MGDCWLPPPIERYSLNTSLTFVQSQRLQKSHLKGVLAEAEQISAHQQVVGRKESLDVPGRALGSSVY